MKNLKISIFLLLLLSACEKDVTQQLPTTETEIKQKASLTIAEAQHWLATQSEKGILSKYPIRWENTRSIKTESGNRIILKMPGAPTINNTKLGYRQLSIQRDPETKSIEAKFLEIIPDPIYWQEKQKVESKDFTGRIMEFDLNYKLQKGMIYQYGKQIGEIKTTSTHRKNRPTLKAPTSYSPLERSNSKVHPPQLAEKSLWPGS